MRRNCLALLIFLAFFTLQTSAAEPLFVTVRGGETFDCSRFCGVETTLQFGSLNLTSLTLHLKPLFINSTFLTAAFDGAPSQAFTLPPGSKVISRNGSLVSYQAPRKAKRIKGKRCVPLFQAPTGVRFYYVDSLAGGQNEKQIAIVPPAAG